MIDFNQKHLVGMKVCTYAYGNGRISAIYTDEPYPVNVTYAEGKSESYTWGGRCLAIENPTLLVGRIEDYPKVVSKPLPKKRRKAAK